MRKRWSEWSRRRKLLTSTAALLLTAFIAIGAWFYVNVLRDLPGIDQVQAGMALPSTRIFDRHGQLLYEILPPQQGRSVALSLNDIPDHCVQAVIAVEDRNFYAHPGVDPVGVARALWINLRGGDVLAGGSTITQQLARTLLLDPQQRAERTLTRKLKEMVLALQLETQYSKDEVLTLYLNQVYFGNLAYGIEGAARAYFGRSAQSLSLAECALLAGIVQNPVFHDPLTNLEGAAARQEIALGLMQDAGFISAEDADTARRDPLQFAASPFPIDAPHAVMSVWAQLERDFPDALYTRGLDVVSTVDANWQRAADSAADLHLGYLNNPYDGARAPANANNAALVALDPFNGQVLAMLGSPDFFDDQISGAVNAALAMRQPGSALKPFTYAAAFDPTRDSPWTAASMTLDLRTAFVTRKLERYVPANYGFVENGPVLVRESLASSYNIPAVAALNDIGVSAMVELAANAGLDSLLTHESLDLAVTLGGAEVTLMEMTAAYSVFANGGYRVPPSLILSVTARDTDEPLYQWRAPTLSDPVLDPRVAYLITDILSDPRARTPAFGRHNLLNIGRPAAAKTGTTTDFRDNWVVGYTPNLVVGVWVGNADNTAMVDVTGISGAAPIWHDFMRRVLDDQPELDFPRPDGLVQVEICSLSGKLPTEYCPNTRLEWFIPGTEPTEYDELYQPFTVDARTGALADETTPEAQRVTEVFVVLPPEAQAWAQQAGVKLAPTTPGVQVADATTDIHTDTAPAGLRLLTPDPYTTYQINPMIPIENQRLHLRVSAPPGTRAVTYWLNGESLGTVTQAPFALWWPLALGDHALEAEAQLSDGSTQRSTPVPFAVLEWMDPGMRPPPGTEGG